MDDNVMQHQIRLDYEGVCGDIERILDDVAHLCTEQYLVKSLGEPAVSKVKDNIEAVRKRLYGSFQIVVVGDFKRGKSTLINALLGEAAVPTAVTPETVTINKLSFAEVPRIEAVLSNKKRVTLTQSELERDALLALFKGLPAPVDTVDIRLNNHFLRNVTIIDTPGLGDLTEGFDQQVAEYLVNADAIVYVTSARAPLSFTEQVFLSASVMPQSFCRIFMAVNMTDTLESEENIEKVRELTESRAGAISDHIYVYMLSALDEFCRKKEFARPEPLLANSLENQFLAFETALDSDAVLQKDIIKSMRGVALTRLMLEALAGRIRLVQDSLRTDMETLSRSQDVFQAQDNVLRANIEKHKASLLSSMYDWEIEAKGWMCDFMDRLKAEIQQLKDDADMGDIQRYFQFYMMDLIKNAMFACTCKHQKDIGDMLQNSVRSISGEISQALFGDVQARIADCMADVSWTHVDTALFAGEAVLNMTGLSAVVGPFFLLRQIIGGAIRQKTVSNKQADVIAPVLQEYDAITQGVLHQVEKIYAQIKKDALSKLDELYQAEIQISSEAIQNARQLACDKNVKIQDVQAFLEHTLHMIANCTERMREYAMDVPFLS
ncbi:dynamin family protein [Oscillospiraceae bacterium MB08-C2-2]|nr:dynamin family protein [Oscillospiraceae bacterium MB08-C2-2]